MPSAIIAAASRATITPEPTTEIPPTATPAPEPPDVFEQIRKLGELRDAGVLTEDEFNAKKSDLLGRL